MSKKDLTVKDTTDVISLDEETLELLDSRAGFEDIGKEDLVIPRLQIAQANSPQLKKSDPRYLPELQQGYIFNTVTGVIYGDEISFLAVKFTKSRALFGEGNIIECSSPNGVDGGHQSPRCVDEHGQPVCPHAQFGSGKNGKGTACTNFKNALGFVLPSMDMVSFSLKSAAISVFRQWNTTAQMRKMKVTVKGKKVVKGDLPLYSTVYKIKVVEKAHPEGSYFTVAITPECWTHEIEGGRQLLKECKAHYDRLKEAEVVVSPEELD